MDNRYGDYRYGNPELGRRKPFLPFECQCPESAYTGFVVLAEDESETYVIIDGNHRLAALRKIVMDDAALNRKRKVPCVVLSTVGAEYSRDDSMPPLLSSSDSDDN